MSELTNPELAVLGLVAEEAQHAYAIEQRINQRGMREWTEIGFSSIYHVLNKLEKADLLVSDLSTEGAGPARRVYRLTGKGGQVFQGEIKDRLSNPRQRSSDFLLALFNLPVLTESEISSALRRHEEGLNRKLDELRLKAAADLSAGAPPHVALGFDYSITMIQAELDWIEQAFQKIKENRMTEKIDLLKQQKHLYNPPKDPITVEVPPIQFLMLDGHGDPNTTQEYKDAVEALYSLAYTLKFAVKKNDGIDYGVMPLEGLWWVEDMTQFNIEDKSNWDWTMMIAQPDFVTPAQVEEARIEAMKKKGQPALMKIRYESYAEGLCAQLMHIGPFSEEGPNIARLHAYIDQAGCRLSGKHHEIYLTDIRRAAPEKWRTVIRQPMK